MMLNRYHDLDIGGQVRVIESPREAAHAASHHARNWLRTIGSHAAEAELAGTLTPEVAAAYSKASMDLLYATQRLDVVSGLAEAAIYVD